MSDVDNLVQDFITEPGVFFVGVKPLNKNSVAAARGSRDRVLPVVGRHLYREIVETCWDGGRIVPSRSKLNYSLLPDSPMTAAAMVDAALVAAAAHGINWTKLRKDKIVGVELVISLPVGFRGDARGFFVDALAWVSSTFPQPVTIIAAVVHMDEAAPHLHVVLVPIAGPGAMNGHQIVGYKGLYNKRVNSFEQQVGQRYGLRKPRRKAKLTYQERQQLAERVLVKMAADGAGWADKPPAVAAMRKMLTADPMPMARALGLVEDEAGDVAPTAHAVAGAAGSAATAGASSTALLCYAVDPDLVGDDLEGDDLVGTDGADGVGQRAGPVVELPDHQDGAHVLAGEAWLVLPTWQLAATGSASNDRTGPPADDDGDGDDGDGDGDGDGDDANFVRERDDLLAAAYCDCELGQFILPRAATHRAIVRAAAEIDKAMP
jgi:hypothetical protein